MAETLIFTTLSEMISSHARWKCKRRGIPPFPDIQPQFRGNDCPQLWWT
jgi:hypothetical protein